MAGNHAKIVILITGANSGIGQATAKLLASSSGDYQILLACRSLQKGQEALNEISDNATTNGTKSTLSLLSLDITSEASIRSAAAAVSRDFGRLDILINNAGILGLEAASLADKIQTCFDTNALGAVLVTEAFKPLLLQSALKPQSQSQSQSEQQYAQAHARIIFVSSAQGSISLKLDPRHPWAKRSGLHYRMSKAALSMAMATYQVELKEQGVKVHAVCPGLVDTNFRRGNPAPPGTMPAATSAKLLLSVVRGERDADAGKLVHKDGVYDW